MRRFPPLPEGHPLLGELCPACKDPLKAGDEVTLIALGPGKDPEERLLAQQGKPYNAVAAAVHWLCAGGEP